MKDKKLRDLNINNFSEKYVRWFFELSKEDSSIAGTKGAYLAELFNRKFPVPPGFVITPFSFDYFLESHNVLNEINEKLAKINLDNIEELEKFSIELRKYIESLEFPSDLIEEINEAYKILGTEKMPLIGVSSDALNILKNAEEPIFVAVRSSITDEFSFCNEETFLNVKGKLSLIDTIKKCFSSYFTAKSILQRKKSNFKMAVIIEKMIDCDKSGIISYTPEMDIKIEVIYGLGGIIQAKMIEPDKYIISNDLKIKDIKISDKKIAIARNSSGKNEVFKLTSSRSTSQTLANSEAIELADYFLKIEKIIGRAQYVEFGIEGKKIFILQSGNIDLINNNQLLPIIYYHCDY